MLSNKLSNISRRDLMRLTKRYGMSSVLLAAGGLTGARGQVCADRPDRSRFWGAYIRRPWWKPAPRPAVGALWNYADKPGRGRAVTWIRRPGAVRSADQ